MLKKSGSKLDFADHELCISVLLYSKPATRNSQPVTRNPQPATRNPL